MPEETAETGTLRDAVEAAFEATEEAPAAAPTEEATEAPAPAQAPLNEEAAPPAAPEAGGRDEKGRFAPKKAKEAAAATPPPPAAPAPGEKAPEAPAAAKEEGLKPPAGWRPEAREKWGTLPREVQGEVIRRERAAAAALDEATEARRLSSAFNQAVGPYEAFIRAEGGTPLGTVSSLLQTALALRTAPPQHKAAIVANMVKNFNVDVGLLDSALAGQPPPQGQGQPQAPAYRDPRVDELLHRLQQAEAQRTQALSQKSHQEVEAFASAHEFLEDVREDMADLLEVASKRGVPLSLEDAYARACQLHPDIAKVLAQREAAQRASATTAAAQKARRAASSVKNSPAGAPPDNRPASLRDALEAAFEGATGR